MLRYSFSFLVFIILSCHEDNIGEEFAPFFNEFKSDAKRRGVNLNYRSVSFKKQDGLQLETGALAKATISKYEKDKNITVDLDWWERSNLDEKKAVLYHEFGHAFLCRSHYYLSLSIMNEGALKKIDSSLIYELFSINDCN